MGPQTSATFHSTGQSLQQRATAPVRQATVQSLAAAGTYSQPQTQWPAVPATATAPPPPRRPTDPSSTIPQQQRHGSTSSHTQNPGAYPPLGQGQSTWVEGAMISQTPPMLSSRTASLADQQSMTMQQNPGSTGRRHNPDSGPPLPPPPASQPNRGRQGSQSSQQTAAATPPQHPYPSRHNTQEQSQPPNPAPRRGATFEHMAVEPKRVQNRGDTLPYPDSTSQPAGSREEHARYWGQVTMGANPQPPSREPVHSNAEDHTGRLHRNATFNVPGQMQQHHFTPEDPDSLWPGPPAPGSFGGGASSSGGSRDSSRVRGMYDGGNDSREKLVGAPARPAKATPDHGRGWQRGEGSARPVNGWTPTGR